MPRHDDTEPCPHCGRQVYEDADLCPGCGNYLTDEDVPPARKPWWVYLCALACLYAVYRWVAG